MYSLTKVLLVDDERLIRQGIIHYIDWTEKGFELIGEASNGKQALQLISEISLILLLQILSCQ